MKQLIFDIIKGTKIDITINHLRLSAPELWTSIIAKEIFDKSRQQFSSIPINKYPEVPNNLTQTQVITAVIQYVRETLVFSTTSQRIIENEKNISVETTLRTKVDSVLIAELYKNAMESATSYENAAEIALQYSFGNCGERAMVAAQALKINGISSELVRLVDHHIFLVIGRNSKTSISDYKLWNKDVILVDLLSEEFFSVDQIKEKIFDVWLPQDKTPQLELWTTVESNIKRHWKTSINITAYQKEGLFSYSDSPTTNLDVPSVSRSSARKKYN